MKEASSWRGDIEPQKTWFDGILFRSQVEARWAIFFNVLEINYEYEKRRFDLGDRVRYLPDFWLPYQLCWVEVKGALPTTKERDKARRLACHTRFNVYIFYGHTLYHRVPLQIPSNLDWYSYSAHVFFANGEEDDSYWWCECPICGSLGLQEEGRVAHLPCGCLGGVGARLDRSHYYYSARIIAAYDKARNAEAVKLSNRDEYILLTDTTPDKGAE
jgi:hypothetical protein